MQWLIDLIIEAIGIPPVFIDRGDPAAADWSQATLTLDGTWNDLDLSALVPANASAVMLNCFIADNLVGKSIGFRKSGNANVWNTSAVYTQVAGILNQQDIIVPASANQKIEYLGDAGIDTILLTVRGWWL